MTNLRDIINAATPGPWEVDPFSDSDTEVHVSSASSRLRIRIPTATGLDGNWNHPIENARFIAAYSPDHALLIEAVIEATRDRFEVWTEETYADLANALAALDTYRKERGYE